MNTEVTSQVEWGWEEGASYINLLKCVCGSRDILPATLPENWENFARCERCGRAFCVRVDVHVIEAVAEREFPFDFGEEQGDGSAHGHNGSGGDAGASSAT